MPSASNDARQDMIVLGVVKGLQFAARKELFEDGGLTPQHIDAFGLAHGRRPVDFDGH